MKHLLAVCGLCALVGCSTSRTVPYSYSTVVAATERMYPAVPLDADVYGADPRQSGFHALGTPARGVTRPAITGNPRLVRKQETRPASEFRVEIIDYRGRPASLDAAITVAAHDARSTEVTVQARDWNTLWGAMFHAPTRDAEYERRRLDEIVSELAHR